MVAVVAAYASFRNGRDFALRYGMDETTTITWHLLVDALALLMVAIVELRKTGHGRRDSGRWTAWASFLFGVTLSLCANVTAAPELSVLSPSQRSRGAGRRRQVGSFAAPTRSN